MRLWNIGFVIILLSFAFVVNGQVKSTQYGLELSIGKRSYHGDLGNGFFNYKQGFYPTGSLRGIYALRKNMDIVAGLSLAKTGYKKDSTRRFLSKVVGLTGALRYRLDGIIPGDWPVSPYVSIGMGFQKYSPVDSLGSSSFDVAIPMGVGVSYSPIESLELFWQMQFGYNFGDKYDKVANLTGNDHFLTSEIGMRYRFGGVKDSDGDGIPDDEDHCPHIKGRRSNHGCPRLKESAKKVFDEAVQAIHFEIDKAVIKPESYPILDKMVRVMKDHHFIQLTISGHTDADGTAAHNLDLSRRRAMAVKRYLIDKGIASDRMETAGFGEAVPIADNATEEGKALNRRVEFEIRYGK